MGIEQTTKYRCDSCGRVADLTIHNHGSVWTLRADTGEGQEWLEALQSEGWQWLGESTLAVEVRCIGALVEGALKDGLTVHSPEFGLHFEEAPGGVLARVERQ
jgi:hypothetical protein